MTKILNRVQIWRTKLPVRGCGGVVRSAVAEGGWIVEPVFDLIHYHVTVEHDEFVTRPTYSHPQPAAPNVAPGTTAANDETMTLFSTGSHRQAESGPAVWNTSSARATAR